jgi:DNA-binding response OmpR family regulator
MNKGIIFLLEDQQDIARMYERAFHLAGHEVLLVHDGASALKELFAMTEPPIAILLDIMVPHINGLDVMKTLRTDARFRAVPVVVLTNSFYKDDSTRFLEAGADLYLIKSDNQIKDIIAKVEDLVHNGRTLLVKV